MDNTKLIGKLVYRVQIANAATPGKRVFGIEELVVYCVNPDNEVVIRRIGDDKPYFVNTELTTDGSLFGFDTTVTLAIKRMEDAILECEEAQTR